MSELTIETCGDCHGGLAKDHYHYCDKREDGAKLCCRCIEKCYAQHGEGCATDVFEEVAKK